MKVIQNLTADFHYKGDLKIEGNIAPGVTLKIEDGGLIVKGNISDHVTIIQTNKKEILFSNTNGANSYATHNGTLVINNSSNIHIGSTFHINGKRIFKRHNSTNPPMQRDLARSRISLSGVEVTGSIGNHVTMNSSESIHIQNFGKKGSIVASGSVHTLNIDECTKISAGGSIETANVEANTTLNACGSIKTANIASHANLKAGGSIKTANIASHANLKAGGSIKIANIEPNVTLNAGGSITTRNKPNTNFDSGHITTDCLSERSYRNIV